MGYKILFIAPYPDLAQIARQVSGELSLDITIQTAHLPKVIDVVDDSVAESTDVIITRGGTALKIKEKVDIPVVEVKVTGFDIIRALHSAKQFGRKVAVIGFPNVIYGTADISDILDIDIVELPVHDQQECSSVVEHAAKQKFDVVVGDTIAVEIAQNKNIKGILIRSGKEAVLNSYFEAREIAEVRRKELARTEQIKTILQFAHSGIIAVDKNGLITVFNPEAERLLDMNSDDVIGKDVRRIIPTTRLRNVLKTQKPELSQLQQIGKHNYVTHRVPIIIDGESMGAVATFQRLEQLQSTERKVRKELIDRGHVAKTTFEDIVGVSDKIKSAINRAKTFSKTDSPIFINGETGTGKELFAQSIHNASLRKEGPFVAVNCAALPESLLESELFGYVKGAFTGALTQGKMGLFEQAHEGTLFLDEVTEIPPKVQARLLRALQEGQIQRIGDDKIIDVNVRVIASTNRKLEEIQKNPGFRRDLYYRLNVLNLQLPPLRERKEDIPLLANYFLRRFSERYRKPVFKIDSQAMERLCDFDWPGNVREFKNIIERLVVEVKTTTITLDDVKRYIPDSPENTDNIFNLEKVTSKTIIAALEASKWNKTLAAKKLGINRITLWRKLKELNIE